MKTVVVGTHRNQYYSRNGAHGGARFGSFGRPSQREYRGVNYRSYQSGAGLLPTPFMSKTCCVVDANWEFAASLSRKTPSPSQYVNSRSGDSNVVPKSVRSRTISIPIKVKLDESFDKEGARFDGFCFSELWAGPAYSNSPPPSSLPLPKFSLLPKRSVSLELARETSSLLVRPISKSAPASPTHAHGVSPIGFLLDSKSVVQKCECGLSLKDFSGDMDWDTMALRRILNLDLTDE